MGRFRFKYWEVILLFFSFSILAASSVLYVLDIPLRKYLLGWQDEEGQERVAELVTVAGSVRRQISTETEFHPLEGGAVLFNFDTVVTGPESSATIRLDDGGVIDLAPNTMVRLAFESKVSLGGIARTATVDIVVGNVKGEAKEKKIVLRSAGKTTEVTAGKKEDVKIVAPPPLPRPKPLPSAFAFAKASPTPAPRLSPKPVPSASPTPDPYQSLLARTRIEMSAPLEGSILSVSPAAKELELPLTLEWVAAPPDAEITLILRKIGKGKGDEPETLVEEKARAVNGAGRWNVTLQEPGTYEWELRGLKGEPIGPVIAQPAPRAGQTPAPPTRLPLVAQFKLSNEVVAIETLPPLVSGQPLSSNAFTGRHLTDFFITLRWKTRLDSSDFHVKVTDATGKRVLAEGDVDDPEYVFAKNQMLAGPVSYVVSAKLKGAWVAISKPARFEFAFLPPKLVVPKNKYQASQKDLLRSPNQGVLLTWHKTNFSQGYEVEVSTDTGFQRIVMKQRVKENFFVVKAPPPGTYFWRVRSSHGKVLSPPSAANELSVTP